MKKIFKMIENFAASRPYLDPAITKGQMTAGEKVLIKNQEAAILGGWRI